MEHMMYSPDSYRVVLIDTPTGQLVKLFASWSGGYCQGDEYRLNSGTELITEDEDSYFFYGYSGSCYKLRKSSKGSLTSYSAGIYNLILSQEGVKEITVQEAINVLKEGEQIDNS
jgi:hypothetical protein